MIVDPFEPPPSVTTGDDAPAPYVGPFDREAWPDKLVAHAVAPGDDARIHGYAVAGDLARHYGVADVAWLSLRGELPTVRDRAAFEVALVLLAPVHIGQAPSHAAFLSRIAGAPPSATIAIGAVGLGEQAAAERTALAPWLAWLDAPSGPVPACALTTETLDGAAARRWLDGQLRDWFGADRGLPFAPLSRAACALAVLHRLGLHDPLVAEAIAVWARLPSVIAEAAPAKAAAVRGYPARLPDYQYIDDRGATP